MSNLMKLEFLSKLDNIRFARNAVASFIYSINPSISFINEIKTIVSEAVTNSIVHGYKEKENEIVIIQVEYDKEYITLEFTDKGQGIKDIEEAKTPLFTTSIEKERSGLGFTIMEVFSDELIVLSSIGEYTIVKCIKRIGDFFE